MHRGFLQSSALQSPALRLRALDISCFSRYDIDDVKDVLCIKPKYGERS